MGGGTDGAAGGDDRWALTLFGGFKLTRNGESVAISNRKARALLGYVALNATHSEGREQLAGLLWSEFPEEKARASLRQVMRALRQALGQNPGSGIAIDRDTTQIDTELVAVDYWTLVRGIGDGPVDPVLLDRQDAPESLLAGLEDLDPAFGSWLRLQRRALHERLVLTLEGRLAGLETLVAAPREKLQLEKEIALALVNLDQTHEGACRRLMLASVREGDVSGALRRYNEMWELLGTEYDMEPSDETQQLVALIKTGRVTILPVPSAAPSAAAAALPVAAVAAAALPDPAARGGRRMRIVIGAFAADGVDPAQRYLVSGFRHQLISSLVRFREWSLIDGARAPLTPVSGEQPTYSISASAYQAHNQLQLVLTLANEITGEFVWSENVSAELATWFQTQKLVVRRMAIALNVHLSADRVARTIGEPGVALPIYDRWLQGEALTQKWRGRNRIEAADMFRSIIEEAPNFAPAYCSIVNFTNSRSHIFPGEVRTETRKQEALELARIAVRLDPTFSRTHLCAAWSYALTGHFEQSEQSFEAAYDLNENDPWTLVSSSLGLAFCARYEKARARADQALDLGLCIEPRHWGYQAVIRFICGDYEGCVEAAGQAEDAIYNFAAWKAAALSHLGRRDAAAAEWQRFVGLVTNDWHGDGPPSHEAIVAWLLQGFPIKARPDWERLRDGVPPADAPRVAMAVRAYSHSRVV